MKKLIIAGLVLCAVVSAYADTMEIYWRTWAFDHTASDLTIDTEDDSNGILNNFDVLWQLIRTDSGTPALPDLSASNYLGAGDSLLTEARYLSGDNHGSWNLALYWDEDARSTIDVGDKTTADSFYIYQRVYELAPGTTAPVEGTYYYDSTVENLREYPEWNAGTPVVFLAVGDEDEGIGMKPTLQVQGSGNVPEPATMSLLGLGALAMVLRRKLRK